MADVKFYFAWVGGITSPAMSLTTTGDIWGGERETFGDVWGGIKTTIGDVHEGGYFIENVENINNLIVGNTYYVTGPGIPGNASPLTIAYRGQVYLVTPAGSVPWDYTGTPLQTITLYGKVYYLLGSPSSSNGAPLTQFTFDGTNTFALNEMLTSTQVGASITIISEEQTTVVSNIGNTDGLVVGRTYAISGGGIPDGTTFTYEGLSTVEISQPATTTTHFAALTISSAIDANVIKNLADVSGLTVGEIYSIWGPGIAANTTFEYEGGTDVTISNPATVTLQTAPIFIKKPRTEDNGGAFDPVAHAVEDEKIFKFEIDHAEGGFPSLKIEIVNPDVGLLGPSRKYWCWLSYDPGTGTPTPLFHGRIVGVPDDLTGPTVTLQFVARPNDFFTQKSALAATMQDPPYWDPLWLQNGLFDPDTVLESRSAKWHIDRTSLDVSASDILNAEDGTIEILEADHLYDEMAVSYGEAPLTNVSVQATVTWTQTGVGDVDLTGSIVDAFQEAGSPFGYPLVGSYSADGLLTSWPQPGASIGGGWSVSLVSSVAAAAWMTSGYYNILYSGAGGSYSVSTLSQATILALAQNPTGKTVPELDGGYLPINSTSILAWKWPTIGALGMYSGYQNWDVTFTIAAVWVDFQVHYEAARKRTEVLVFQLGAQVQSVLLDPDGSDSEIVELSSNFVDQPVDPGGALPIGDLRRNSYFPTDRGQQSLEFLLLMARAKLLARARAVSIKFTTAGWSKVDAITCRMAVLLHDGRLPGGQASGKVIGYTLRMEPGGGGMTADVKIGCAVGYGGALPAGPLTTDSYADSYSSGYDAQSVGAMVTLPEGDIEYQSLDGTYVLDDDGVDLFNMTPQTVVLQLEVENGPNDQKIAIDYGASIGDPVGQLKGAPTRVSMQLVPVQGGDFLTYLVVNVADLLVPQTINLEA